MTAAFEGHADIVQTLIEVQAQINRQNEVYTRIMLFLPPCTRTYMYSYTQYYIHFHQAAVLSAGDCVFVSTQGGWTAFHLAAQEGKVDVVRLLLTDSQTLVNIQTMVMNKLHE